MEDQSKSAQRGTRTARRTPPKQWYILVAINHYIQGTKARVSDKGETYRVGHLNGCVNDIEMVEKYLLQERGAKTESIFKLVSQHADRDDWETAGPVGDRKFWPTYLNIVDLFAQITKKARPGDLVYIHYAGHGGSIKPTLYPILKGNDQVDESLVPCDINTEEGRYIRDLEMAVYLRRMVKKNLIVTILLDSCHSSSATRAARPEDGTPRAVPHVDATPGAIPVFTEAEIVAEGVSVPTGGQRSSYAETEESFKLAVKGYEMIAACRFDQTAKEVRMEDDFGKHGIFTYNFIKTLKESDGAISHSAVFNRLLKLIDMKGKDQVPVFAGNGERLLFDSRSQEDMPATVGVKDWEKGEEDTYITLTVGRLQGIAVNAEYLLFPWNTVDYLPIPTTPRVVVTYVDEMFSKAKFVSSSLNQDDIERVVYRAVPIKSPVEPLKVYLLRNEAHSTDNHDQEFEKLQELEAQLYGGTSRDMDLPVTLVASGWDADYHIRVDNSRYVLREATGSNDVPHFPSTDSTLHFVAALGHLAKFRMARNLENENENELREHYEFKVTHKPAGSTLSANGKHLTIRNGDRVTIGFKNNFVYPLNVCILNLQPLWGIAQIHPASKYGEVYDTVPVGGRITRTFRFRLPDIQPLVAATDYLKAWVFYEITAGTDLKTLLMPELKADRLDGVPSNRGSNDLARFLATMGIPSRNVEIEENPPPWDTCTLAITVNPTQ